MCITGLKQFLHNLNDLRDINVQSSGICPLVLSQMDLDPFFRPFFDFAASPRGQFSSNLLEIFCPDILRPSRFQNYLYLFPTPLSPSAPGCNTRVPQFLTHK